MIPKMPAGPLKCIGKPAAQGLAGLVAAGIAILTSSSASLGFAQSAAMTSASAVAIVLPPLPQVVVTLPKHGETIHLNYPAPAPSKPSDIMPGPPRATVADPVASSLAAVPAALPENPALIRALAALPSPGQPLGKPLLAHTYGNFRAAVSQQYAINAQQPIFAASDGGGSAQWSDAARGLALRLSLAAHDGIDLKQTPLPTMNIAPTDGADVALTAAVLNYAWQAEGGRVNPSFISRFVELKPTILPPADVLASIRAAGSTAGQALQKLNPHQPGYQRLRSRLIALLAQRPAPEAQALLSANQDAHIVRAGVDLVQRRWRADRNGLVVNMEFWRWQQPATGSAQIVVNIPEFALRLRKGGQTLLMRKVIVGKSTTPTPLLNSKINYIIINPSWHVPQSIVQKDFLPKLESNPDYLAEHGFDVHVKNGQLIVKQPPGPHNALGLIKFIFPNDQSVYLHDTSERRLFSSRFRAFSHGCVRLQEPFSLAAALLGTKWPQKRLKSMVGSREHYLRFDQVVPIQIEYFTIYAKGNGQLVQFADLYGYAGKVQTALGLRT